MTLLLRKIISGGQIGADQAGLRAAKALGLLTGGWVPKGCKTLAGYMPTLTYEYGCRQHSSPLYPPRTYANVRDSDATVRFAFDFGSPGELCTLKAIQQYKRPYFDVNLHAEAYNVDGFRKWLEKEKVRTLNVAGNAKPTTVVERQVYLFLIKALKYEDD